MIKYNKDLTFNLSAMTKLERDNYDHAYAMVKQDMIYDAPRETIEDYMSEKDITDGYSDLRELPYFLFTWRIRRP